MITALFSKVWGYILTAGVLLAGVAAFWFKAKHEGADQERAKQRKRDDEVRDKMDKVPEPDSDDVDDSLRRHDF